MSSNQRGPTLVAPEYGVTWGGLPMYARRAMTVGLATLVAAGVAGPATAQAAEVSSADQVSVIVRELANSGTAPEPAVVRQPVEHRLGQFDVDQEHVGFGGSREL